ncbi:hypothetical protein O9X98_10675 [Agrobacterium salinitolerans]|nr:hypothetical protein [Agrobacterium salinitolerans]
MTSIRRFLDIPAGEIVQFLATSSRELALKVCRDQTTPVYVVGNSRDFDQFAQHFVDALGRRFAGVATFWPEPLELEGTGEKRFTAGNRYIGRSSVSRPDLLFCQSVISSPREIRAMISTVLGLIEVANIGIAAVAISEEAEVELKRYFHEGSSLPIEVTALKSIPDGSMSSWQVQTGFYDELESALGEGASALPEIVRAKLRGKLKPH